MLCVMVGHLRQLSRGDGSWYDLMQVCESGHKITAFGYSDPNSLKQYCTDCGAKTHTKCTKCGAELRGYEHIKSVAYPDYTTVPLHCEKCGETFPWTSALQAKANVPVKRDALQLVLRLAKRFPEVAQQIRRRHDSRPTLEVEDEYDVQDLLHAMLRIDFEDVREEEWAPSVAGASSRIDFVLKAEKIVFEVKKTRRGLKDKEIGEQIIIDIARYKGHPDCNTLVCLIHDPERRIVNPGGLIMDLESRGGEGFSVRVVIA